jgi:tetratricopeptide (TPR) repeat protein
MNFGTPEHRLNITRQVLACCCTGLLLISAAGMMESGWAQSVAPGQQEQLRQRFLAGKELVEKKRFLPALQIFEEILQVDPQARGSLLMSGLTYNQLQVFDKASSFFERFLLLEPDNLSGNLGALKAYQSSGKNEQALAVRDKILELKRLDQDPRFKILLSFEREVRQMPSGQTVSVQEAYPGTETETFAWKVLLLKKGMTSIDRAVEWKRATVAEKKLLEMGADQPLWFLSEPVFAGGELKEVKVRKIHQGELDYSQAVDIAVEILK